MPLSSLPGSSELWEQVPLKELFIAFKYSGIRERGSIAARQAWAQHVTAGGGFNVDLSMYVYLNGTFLCPGSHTCNWMAK